MKRNIFIVMMLCAVLFGTFLVTSCKRTNLQEPPMMTNAGFHISLSGTASPSDIYLKDNSDTGSSLIEVRVLRNDGTPVANQDVIFNLTGGFLVGYFDNYKLGDMRTTNAAGMTSITYFVPAASVKTDRVTYIRATLSDGGRGDVTPVNDVIPVRIYPTVQQGVVLGGVVRTAAGNGVSGITLELNGENGYLSSVAVSGRKGAYEFVVPGGWMGTIEPVSLGYDFNPTSYTFGEANPAGNDRFDLNFIAFFESGDNLVTDVSSLDVPAEGIVQSVNVYNGTGDSPINYIVVPDANWIHVSRNTGRTPGYFTITVDENTTGINRVGSVTVTATGTQSSSATIDINQLGNDANSDARLAVDIQTLNMPNETYTSNINVYNATTSDPISFIITTIPENSWISVSSNSGGTPTSFNITVDDNYGPARSGIVRLTPTSTGVNNVVDILVNQDAGPSIDIDITSKSVAVGGETFMVNVSNPYTSDAVSFTVNDTSGWVHRNPHVGSTPAQIAITVDANNTGQVRTTTVTFVSSYDTTVTLTITQQGS